MEHKIGLEHNLHDFELFALMNCWNFRLSTSFSSCAFSNNFSQRFLNDRELFFM